MAKLAGRVFAEWNFSAGETTGDTCHLSVNAVKELHQQQLDDLKGRQYDLYMCLGDSHAAARRLEPAYRSYLNAYAVGGERVTPDRLNNLVSSLVDIVRIEDGERSQTTVSGQKDGDDTFACALCQSLWSEPVTLCCGHTYCKTCLEHDRPKRCKRCLADVNSSVSVTSLKTNVLLSHTVEKWFPEELAAVRLKQKGNMLFGQKKLDSAVSAYTKAIEHDDSDHLIFSNRSFTYVALGQFEEALVDADAAIKLKPDWPKGYYRKGAALFGLRRHEESVLAYLQCLAIDPGVTLARKALAKVLHEAFSTSTDNDLDQARQVLNPTPWQQFDPCVSSPVAIDVGKLKELKESMQQSVPQAVLRHCRLSANVTSTCDVSQSTAVTSRKRSHNASTMESQTDNVPTKHARVDVISATSSQCHRPVDPSLCLREDFECSLCLRMLYQPITTPCGHVFCRSCLYRSLDYNNKCPLCKTSLSQFLAKREDCTTVAVEEIMQTYFTEDYAKRKKCHDEEMSETNSIDSSTQPEIPIFVCTLAYPKIPCPLHIFEPRYRLMIRRCMESGVRKFGMCIAFDGNQNDFAEYGCMLEIRNVQHLPDGRSVLDTVGGQRFRVLSKRQKDGYHMARVEFVKDTTVEESAKNELKQLHDAVYKEGKRWLSSLPPVPQMQILQHFGEFPAIEDDIFSLDDGPSWLWWLTAVLPIDKRAQHALLRTTSLRDRLLGVHKFLLAVNRCWTT
ncbi:hypothetical protein NP493_643g01042 [Ridgeia piscesae]|uniref:LON peptidase N-terminal domain and RING finger protein 3 n=1 Tax=Ridgeia piscesae TaxID=27915 RepID=A0AAD9KS96_RIDPI|nr:hypothetical protein NP493_643g01042 [Ridgeia piscesae]